MQKSAILYKLQFWVVLLSITLLVQSPGGSEEKYDIIIRDARVLDGSGNPWFRADVAIRGDKIAAVGNLEHAIAEKTIDASGNHIF